MRFYGQNGQVNSCLVILIIMFVLLCLVIWWVVVTGMAWWDNLAEDEEDTKEVERGAGIRDSLTRPGLHKPGYSCAPRRVPILREEVSCG